MAYKEGMHRIVVGYAKLVAESVEVIQQYYTAVDGHRPSKAEVFRRAVIDLARHITQTEKGTR